MEGTAIFAVAFSASIVILILVGVFWWLKRAHDNVVEQMKRLGQELGLNVTEPTTSWGWVIGKYPELRGTYERIPLYVYMFVRRAGRSAQIYTAFQFQLNNRGGNTLRLYKEGFFSKVGKALGGQDVQLGDSEFDPKFMLKSDNERFVKSLLTPQMRDLLVRNHHLFRGELTLEGNMLEYKAMYTIRSDIHRTEFKAFLSMAAKLSAAIQDSTSY